jgi:hypothetical protein
MGGDGAGLNAKLENNKNGMKVLFEKKKTCGPNGNDYCACFVPQNFNFPLINPQTG